MKQLLSRTAFVFLYLCLVGILAAQSTKIDSLQQLLKQNTKADTNQVKTLLKLSRTLFSVDIDSTLKYTIKAYELSRQLNYIHGEAKAQNILGACYYMKSDYAKAIKYFKKSLQTNEILGNKIGLSDTYNNIGAIYKIEGNYPKTLEYFQKSLTIDKEINDLSGIAGSYSNIGIVYDILEEPLRLQGMTQSVKETTERIAKTLEDMDLIPPEEFMYRFPHELSGGQRQRIAIARAFILNPEFIVADEPVSMLDASTRTEVVKLILHLVGKLHCSFLYITHDIALTRYLCNRIAVMYLGKIVEMGPTEEVIQKPLHPYTEALIAAVPVPDPTAKRTKIVIKGEVPSPINLPSGCRFHPRCPYAKEKCRREEPKIIPAGKDRYVACHFPLS